MSEVRRSELSVGGLRTVLREAGPSPDGEAVVFVHGVPNSGAEWEPLMSAVGEFAPALAVDMPGFGKADKPRSFGWPVQGYAEFLAAALEQLDVRRAHLVLHDFGGPWGLAWATGHGDALGSVVLFNTGVLLGMKMHTAGRIWGTPVAGELFQALTTRRVWRAMMGRTNPMLPAEFVDAMYDDYDAGTKRTIVQLYRVPRASDQELLGAAEVLRALDRPALVMWGARDELVPVRHADDQLRAFPRAEIVVLEDSGHWPFVDDPDGAAARTIPFLRDQTGRSAERPR
jgi:pimeloyl-ACP methyl ester carboxylesterase